MAGSTTETTCEICHKTIPLEPELMYAGRYYCPDDYRKKTGKEPYPDRQPESGPRPILVEHRYGFTRAVIAIFRIVAVLAVIGASVMGLNASADLTFGPDTIMVLIVSFAAGLFLLAGAEGLQVVLDMEEHQRSIRLHMEEARKKELPSE